MIKVFRTGLAIMAFSPIGCFAEIIRTNDFSIVENIMQCADQETLVIFDVGEVLIMPTDVAFHPKHRPYLRQKINDASDCGKDTEKDALLWSYIQRDQKPKLVDLQMPLLIKSLQAKGVQAIALTSMVGGAFGVITSMEEWRYQQLKSFGIQFEKAWQGRDQISLGLEGVNFYKGIIVAWFHKKGDVLKEFLKHHNFKKIIFIDDNVNQIESVAAIEKELGLNMTCIHYTAVMDRSSETLNQNRAAFQFEVLLKEKKWLSDKQADEELNLMEHRSA